MRTPERGRDRPSSSRNRRIDATDLASDDRHADRGREARPGDRFDGSALLVPRLDAEDQLPVDGASRDAMADVLRRQAQCHFGVVSPIRLHLQVETAAEHGGLTAIPEEVIAERQGVVLEAALSGDVGHSSRRFHVARLAALPLCPAGLARHSLNVV